MQDKLRPGTIVVIDSTLVTWHISAKGSSKGRKVSFISYYLINYYIPTSIHCQVYQVQGHRVQILHESDGPLERLEIPSLPQKIDQKPFTFDTSPRKAASTAFNAFGSPSKKPRYNLKKILQTFKFNLKEIG